MGTAPVPDVSLIVVAHDNEGFIQQCLLAAKASVSSCSAEIVVVDNASSDGTIERAIEVAPGATIVPLKRNVGFATANNQAVEHARGRYIVLVNSDAFLDPGAVDRLVSRVESNPRIGLVGGALRYPSGRRQPSTGSFPSVLGNLGVAILWHRLPILSRLSLSVAAGPSHYRQAHRVDWVSGAFCLARREIGPMPAAGFMYGEDVEWAYRAREHGFETWLEPRATAVHLGGGGTETVAGAIFRQRSRVDFELRWFGPKGRAAVIGDRVAMILHALVRIALSAAILPVRPALARARIAEFTALLRAALQRL